MSHKKWNPAKYPIPEEKELLVSYDPEADILVLWNGTPASNGFPIATGLMVFSDAADEPQSVVLENASKSLLPLLECLAQLPHPAAHP